MSKLIDLYVKTQKNDYVIFEPKKPLSDKERQLLDSQYENEELFFTKLCSEVFGLVTNKTKVSFEIVFSAVSYSTELNNQKRKLRSKEKFLQKHFFTKSTKLYTITPVKRFSTIEEHTSRFTKTILNELRVYKGEEDYDAKEERKIERVRIKFIPISFRGRRKVDNNLQIVNTSKNKNKNENKRGGEYVELPKCLTNLHALLNIKNKDNMCFLWCVIAALFPSSSKNPSRLGEYKKHFNKLNTSGLEFPVDSLMIETFASMNGLHILIWELTLPLFNNQGGLKMDKDNIELSCINETKKYTIESEGTESTRQVNLLLYRNHYILIKNVSNFVKWVLNAKSNILVCDYCHECYFYNVTAYEKHIKICMLGDDEMHFEIPITDKQIRFRNICNRFKSVFCIYADIESILVPEDIEFGKNSTKINRHYPIAIGYAIKKSTSDIIDEMYIYGEDCINTFFTKLLHLTFKINHEMGVLESQIKKRVAREDSICSICGLLILNANIRPKNEKYKSKEYHLSNDKYFGDDHLCAHKKCLMNLIKRIFTVKVFFHNLKGYDSHFLINEMSRKCIKMSVIPLSREKYLSFQGEINACKINFLDSNAFLQGSLASNAENLSSFTYIGSEENISNMSLRGLDKYQHKQVFPYEYVTSIKILETEPLPDEDKKWFSKLSNSCPSRKDIDFALNTMKELNFVTIKDYMMFYLRIDVLLLLEIFEVFRKLSINEYGLDPSHYFTAPGMAWDAALKMSKQTLEILSDPEMVTFFCQPGTIRGGISSVSEKKWAIDSEFLKSDVNSWFSKIASYRYKKSMKDLQCIANRMDICETSKEESSILYFDVTNLYGYAMTQPLPVGEFEFVNFSGNENYIFGIIKSWNVENEFGYILEVDLEIPIEMHDTTNELPLFPERYNNKLVPTLFNKYNYRVHIFTLQQGLEKGVKLISVYKIIRFRQKRWLKGYIEHNTRKRAETSDENLKKFYKLMNNSVYGKTMDTDSFIVNLKIHYSDIEYSGISQWFDLSSYPKTSKLYDPRNKGVLGTLKDEHASSKVIKFVCLRSKCYIVQLANGEIIIKNKGVSKCKGIRTRHFEEILRSSDPNITNKCKSVNVIQVSIKSFEHVVYTVSNLKKALSTDEDTKRVTFINREYTDFNRFETKAIGHYSTLNTIN